MFPLLTYRTPDQVFYLPSMLAANLPLVYLSMTPCLLDQLSIPPSLMCWFVFVFIALPSLLTSAKCTEPSNWFLQTNLHRFVWRKCLNEPLKGYRMTRVTFECQLPHLLQTYQWSGDFFPCCPLAAQAMKNSFYVETTVWLELTQFKMPLNCKNNSRSYSSASGIRVNLLFCWCHMRFSQIDGCTNWLRNWQKKLNRPTPRNRSSDQFRLTVSELLTSDYLTKRLLVSDIAKTFDVLGWFSPSIIKTKLLLQRCWEQKLNWDDPVSSAMYDAWYNWRSSLQKNVFTLLLWHISNHLFWTLRVSVMHQNMPSLPTDDWPLRKCWGHSDNIKYQGSSDKAIDDTSSWIMWTITYWLI